MARYRYVNEGGRVRAILVPGKVPTRGTPDYMRLSTHERILHGYREAELKGVPWHDSRPKGRVKDIHERANLRT